ncbi:MAG: extracellular solute-binding protein [Rhodospirillales bacterium]
MPPFLSRLAAAAVVLLAGLAAARAQEEKVVNVYNWNDYVTEEALKAFTDKTGIRINYDVYDSNDLLEAKLLAGRSGYDVVFPSATPYFAKQMKAGLYRPLDRSRIPNAAGIDPDAMARLKVADPQNAFGLPYMMAGTGIGWNVDKVRALLPDAPTGSLDMIFEPAVVRKLAPCGVVVLDAAEEVLSAALAWLGRDPTDTSTAALDAAAAVVAKVRPHYRYIHSSSYINDLAGGSVCVALGYAGDLVQARSRAREANAAYAIGVALPKEGAAFNIDVMAIPKDAPHPGNAHLFIDHLLAPANIAAVSARIGYANAVTAATPLLPAAVRDDPVIYPPPGFPLYAIPEAPRDFERARTRAWTRLKAGR